MTTVVSAVDTGVQLIETDRWAADGTSASHKVTAGKSVVDVGIANRGNANIKPAGEFTIRDTRQNRKPGTAEDGILLCPHGHPG